MTILVVVAHPDDEVLGCVGTIAVHAADGNDVHVAILGEGISSRHAQRGDALAEHLAKIRVDANAAARTLGARSVLFGGLPDNRFDQVPLLDVTKQVEAWLEKLRPEAIY